jgi:hypothetical protein
LGIATGSISGIIVIDIDPRHRGDESLAEMEAKYGKLPATLTAETGGGGRHLFYRYCEGAGKNRVGIAPGIDVRGDEGYVVAAPSIHASGKPYSWLSGAVPELGTVAGLPPAWRELLMGSSGSLLPLQSNRAPEQPKQSRVTRVNLEGIDESTKRAIVRALNETLPKKPGERNHCLFKFTKALRGMEALKGVDPNSLLPIIRAWAQKALPLTSGEHDVNDCQDEFLYAWPRVLLGGNISVETIAIELVGKPPHPACEALKINGQPRRILVGLCWELQKLHKDKPFYLSCREAAKALTAALGRTYSHVTASTMLNGLEARGAIKKVQEHTATRARRYVFVWCGECLPNMEIPDWLANESI